MWFLLRFVPKNYLSRILGRFSEIPLPRVLSTALIRLYAGYYRINLDEISKPIAQYRTLADFFVRDLKPGARPIPADATGYVLSPVDGYLRDYGAIGNGRITQVKGLTYRLKDLLGGDEALSEQFEGGYYFNLYLSPSDYHHVHLPLDGDILERKYIPGFLWPVNSWSLKHIKDLFPRQERLISVMESRGALVSLVMVGATNVGKMTLVYDDIVTNSKQRAADKRVWERGRIRVRAGDRLGTFNLGSSVVLLLSRQLEVRPVIGTSGEPGAVRYGQIIAELRRND